MQSAVSSNYPLWSVAKMDDATRAIFAKAHKAAMQQKQQQKENNQNKEAAPEAAPHKSKKNIVLAS